MRTESFGKAKKICLPQSTSMLNPTYLNPSQFPSMPNSECLSINQSTSMLNPTYLNPSQFPSIFNSVYLSIHQSTSMLVSLPSLERSWRYDF
jgi:hypothetical protein